MSITFNVCGIDTDFLSDDDSTYVNVNNSNGRDILDRLGLSHDNGDMCGEILAYDALQACNTTLSSIEALLDCGREEREYTGAKGVKIVDCGREAGHLNTRIAQIRTLCERALAEIGPLAVLNWS